jgi:serine/threonine protein kinase
MEYAENGSLYDLLHSRLNAFSHSFLCNNATVHRDIEYTDGHTVSWMHQTCAAVQYVHNKSIIHRDLKSLNILMCGDYTHVKLADFGLATNARTVMTSEQGTWYWMAPEVGCLVRKLE